MKRFLEIQQVTRRARFRTVYLIIQLRRLTIIRRPTVAMYTRNRLLNLPQFKFHAHKYIKTTSRVMAIVNTSHVVVSKVAYLRFRSGGTTILFGTY